MERTTQNGVQGFRITSKSNGNSLFLPAAGYMDDVLGEHATDVGTGLSYWSRTLYQGTSSGAYSLFYRGSGIPSVTHWFRSTGRTVRPVRIIIN